MCSSYLKCTFFFFNAPPTTEIYTLSLHDALPISIPASHKVLFLAGGATLQFAQVPMNLLHGKGKADYIATGEWSRSEEHTSELQSRQYLVCRLLLEKKKRKKI